ncbi:MAG TPA: 1,4-alpha-glucan branching protein GlgB [Clostridiaceae bacterium]|nr:1,4-alpha-glucan branching protein GlgB [Clostridiaceae bacterium]
MKPEFYTGDMFDAWHYLGAHPIRRDGQMEGVKFSVYAPNAEGIDVIGEFNDWTWGKHPLTQRELSGVWDISVPEAKIGMMYKYVIHTKEGWSCEHTDPYARQMELRPNFATIIVDDSAYTFNDEEWLAKRSKCFNQPLNIYEVHLGSWRQKGSEEEIPKIEQRWYNYQEIADMLVPYIKEQHYTHVELLPITEHPADESWGYQVVGFYAATSRYGTPEQLKYFVDKCHQEGIGVIMDFVPVHFALDYYGLSQFDGTSLYEYPDIDTGHSEWGSRNFNYYRGEVCTFLQSAANYWIEEFHIDGLRIDAVKNIIYWQGNPNRGINEGGVKFIQNMNAGLQRLHPDVIFAAEDSSDYSKVTAPVEYDGLGFDYKWDMGWMNDTLDYFRTGPFVRGDVYHKLSFSMMYFYNENFILPLSHDEVTQGKATIMQKMYGNYEEKFPQAKALYMYMYTHPGKKLNFMGNEWGHFREWHAEREMDWDLLKYPMHDSFREYIKELSHCYLNHPCLYDKEYAESSYRWLEVDRPDVATYVYERINDDESIIVVLNMSGLRLDNFVFGYDEPTRIKRILSSDEERFSGATKSQPLVVETQIQPYRNWSFTFTVDVPPFTGIMFLRDRKQDRETAMKRSAQRETKKKSKVISSGKKKKK